MLKRMMAILLALSMVMMLLPISTLAAEQQTVTKSPEASVVNEETEASAPEFTLKVMSEENPTTEGGTALSLYLSASEEITIGSYQFTIVAAEGVEFTWNGEAEKGENNVVAYVDLTGANPMVVDTSDILLGQITFTGVYTAGATVVLNDVEVGVTGAAAQTVVAPTYYLNEMNNAVAVTGTRHFEGYFNGLNMTVTGEGDFAVTHNGQTVAAVNGKVEMAVTSENRKPVQFAITGEGTFQVAFANPAGSWENPDQLVEGINTAVIEEGSMGYYYIYTATDVGILTITMPEGDWTYTVNNLTTGVYGDTQWSDSDPVISSTEIEVAPGDNIQLIVCTYDPENWFSNPAGELAIEVVFNYLPGSEQSPIFLNQGENALTIPAGATVYYQGRFGGMIMTAVGAGATLAHNGKTYTLSDKAVIFDCFQASMWAPSIFVATNTTGEDISVTLTVSAPVGTQENPAQMVMGENTATIQAGNAAGYYFTWTAETDSVLTITMPKGNWTYTVNNMTTYAYGETQWSDSDPVINPCVLEVKAGHEIQLIVNTYDPANPFQAPAGTVTFTAALATPECAHENNTAVIVDATCTEAGSTTVTCDDCGSTIFFEEIPALGHNFVDGTCSVCGEQESGSPLSGSDVTATPEEPIEVVYTAESNGILSVTISGTPGYQITVVMPNGETSIPECGADQAIYTYDVEAGGTYIVRMVGFDMAMWSEDTGSISYTISFQEAQGGDTEKNEYEVDYDHYLTVGNNTLTLLDTAITTIYEFAPDEIGVYAITAPEGAVVGIWGYNWVNGNPNSTSNVCQWTCTSVGQSILVGVSGVAGEFNLNVTKTGAYNPIVYTEIEYTNKAELSQFEVPEGATLGDYVDISVAHTAVLGEDGYYHLDSVDGPVLLIDMNYQDVILTSVLNSERPVMNLTTNELLEDGSYIKYSLINAVQAYEKVMDADGYYPVTEDIILFYKDYATAQGIWSFHGVEGESVWMYCMRTMTLPEKPVELIKWAGTNVNLGGALAVNFALDIRLLNGTTDNYIVLTRIYADGTDDVITIPQSEWVPAGGSFMKVSYTNLAAKEMGDVITAVVYNAEGNVISETRTDSMASYALRMLKDQRTIANKVLRTLYVDMLNYGAAAQLYFGYNAENLVNAELTEEQASWASEPVEISNYREMGGCYLGSNLSLVQEIFLQVAFNAAYKEGMYATVSFTDHYGKAQQKTVPVTPSGSYSIVLVEGMAIADYRGLVTCTLYSADGAELGYTIDSMESYASRMADSLKKNGADLGDAIMKLGASSYAYFRSLEK